MPEFPPPTHGPPGSGLKPYVTVNQAIADIPAWATMHNPKDMRDNYAAWRQRNPNKPQPIVSDGNLPLQLLIDTKGPRGLHPKGKRKFTVREVLRLQGFPDTYEYHSDKPGKAITYTDAMTMAGDAVPPKAFKPFMRQCKRVLEKTDEMVENYVPPPLIKLGDTIVLDD